MNRRLVIVAGALVLAAGLVVLLGFIMSLRAVELREAQLPSKAAIDVDAPGTWLLWRSDAAGGEPELVGPDDQRLSPARTIRTIVFSSGDHTWRVAGRFEFDAPGAWTFDGGTGPWALGPDPLLEVKFWSLLTVSLAIVLLGAGACTGWIAFRTGPRGRMAGLPGDSRG